MAFRILVGGPPDARVPEALVQAAVEAALRDRGVDDAEISVAFLPDEPIRTLNRTWLDHDWVPDVLSFGLHDEGEMPLGDIYIGIDQAFRQAREHGVDGDEELVRLAIHGTLHVLGADHPATEDGRDGSPFFASQEALVARVMADPPGPGGRSGRLQRSDG